MTMRFTQAQLDAYNARQRRGTPPAVALAVESEAELHEAIFAECRRRRWLCFHGAMSERTHRTLGEPDFIVLADGGRFFLIECKSRSGKVRPEQLAVIHAAAALGHAIHICRSFQQFMEVSNREAKP